MKRKIADAIREVITTMMEGVMTKVLQTDPFIPENHHSAKPVYAALVPDEIFKGSHFERRFVTPFGHVWEKLASVVAIEQHGHCEIERDVRGVIAEGRLQRIQEVLNKLEHPARAEAKRVTPNWNEELSYILGGGGQLIPSTVTYDLYIDSKLNGRRYAIELKGPLPNSDQTKVSKEKMFKLLAMKDCPIDHAYYALPYNPYGRREDYAWSFPRRWFDMAHDESVKMGSEFWDLIGGDGTYESFIRVVNSLGRGYRERIYREFLCMEPPASNDVDLLN